MKTLAVSMMFLLATTIWIEKIDNRTFTAINKNGETIYIEGMVSEEVNKCLLKFLTNYNKGYVEGYRDAMRKK